jgi:hypothetical protein
MKIEEVKKNLNKMVRYGEKADIYKLIGCTLRKNDKGFYYEAELLDTKHGKSLLICKLEDIEVS